MTARRARRAAPQWTWLAATLTLALTPALTPALAGCGSKEAAPKAGKTGPADSAPAGAGAALRANGEDGRGAAANTAQAVDAAAPPPPDDTEARVARAQQVVQPGIACVPTLDPEQVGGRLLAGTVDGAPVVCLHQRGEAFVGLAACWTVDPATAALTYRPPALLPGVGIDVEVDERGCAYGYCRPGGRGDDAAAWIARSTDGNQVALTSGGDGDLVAHVFGGRGAAPVREVPLGGDAGLTNSLDGLVFVSQTLFVRGVDAGPWAGVWAFGAGEVPLVDTSPLLHVNDGDRDPYGNVFAGGVHVLDRTRALVTVHGLTSAVIADAGRHAVTPVKRKAGCKPAELDGWLTSEEPPSRACKKWLASDVEPFTDASFTALPSGDLLSVSLGASELRVLDGKTLATKKKLALPRCPT